MKQFIRAVTIVVIFVVMPLSVITKVQAHEGNSSADIVHACVKNGDIKIVGVNGKCNRKETPLHYALVGAASHPYALGDAGPGGGIVYYLYDSSGKHGLEAQANDETLPLNLDSAVIAANAYNTGGVTGWRLPTTSELKLLIEKEIVVGGLGLFCYWSSTEPVITNVFYQFILHLDEQKFKKFASDKSLVAGVRVVRAF